MLELLTSHISYLGIIVTLVLTGSGLPIPEELIVILSGLAAHNGLLNPWWTFGALLVGALLGDGVMYWIGYHFGRSVLLDHPWFARFLKPAREHHIEEMIRQHGLKVFFAARFLVGLRSPVYITAGILRVPFRRFVLVDTVCATTVIGVFYGMTLLFADRIHVWWQWIRRGELAITSVVVAAIAGLIVYLYVLHRRRLARFQARLAERHLRTDQRERRHMRSKSVA